MKIIIKTLNGAQECLDSEGCWYIEPVNDVREIDIKGLSPAEIIKTYTMEICKLYAENVSNTVGNRLFFRRQLFKYEHGLKASFGPFGSVEIVA